MPEPLGARRWLAGHVESLSWHLAGRGDLPAGIAGPVRELRTALGPGPVGGGPPSGRLAADWAALGAGAVDWATVLPVPDHPGWRHVGTAALLHAIAGGLLADPAGPGARAVVHFGLGAGWFAGSPDRPVPAEELRRLGGGDLMADPLGWLAARLRFELDWFWAPLGQLAGVPDPAPPDRVVEFRRASVAVNLPAIVLREASAGRLAAALRAADRPLRVLDVGAGLGVHGSALAAHPGSRVTAVDHAGVLELTGLVVAAAGVTDRYDWCAAPPAGPPPPGLYDLVLAVEVLHTVPVADVPAWLAGLAGVLAPGGRLVLVDPLLAPDRSGPVEHLVTQVKLAATGGGRVWDGPALAAALRVAGLRPARPQPLAGATVVVASAPGGTG